ncbi:hypothetical protein [Salmonella enterica]|uniref:hypothetical protein n=1 Tax=Salmonella enterica TaxID=28901 RepID=UPI003A8106D0
MEYLNEDNFKDLDKFIKDCTDTSAAIGNLDEVTASIDGMFMIPIRPSTVYVGELHTDGNATLKDYEDMISMGLDLNEDEVSHYHELLAAYEEMQNNSK